MYQFFFRITKLIYSLLAIAILVTCGWCKTYAQDQHKIDSLKTLLNKPGNINAETLIELSIQHVDHDLAQALSFANEAYAEAKQDGDSARIVKAGRIKGQILRRIGDLNQSINAFKEVLPISKRNHFTRDYKLILNSLALAYTFKADYENALKYHFESLVLREAEGDKKEISITLNNLGLVYFKMSDWNRAIEYYNRSLELKKEANDSYDLDRLYINLGLSYNNLGEFKKAQEYINTGLAVCNGNCSEQANIEGQFGLGLSFFELKDFIKAENCFVTSLTIAKKIGDKRFQVEDLIYLSKIAVRKNDLSGAKNKLREAEELAKNLGLYELLIEIYRQYYDVFHRVKDYENESLYREKYISLKDSIYSSELMANLTRVQSNFEERKNLKTIADKNAVLKLKEEIIRRQQSQYFFIITIMVLILGLASLLFWANQKQRKNNHDLATAKVRIEEQNKVLEIKVNERTEDLNMTIEALNKVNQELDNFIYKTSHDIRGPLATLRGMCNIALKDVKDQQALEYLSKLDFTAEKLNTILTRLLIVNQINQSVLEPVEINVGEVVEEILQFEKKKGLPPRLAVRFLIPADTRIISDLSLFKIILENLIDNAIKFYNNSDRVEPFVQIEVVKTGENVLVKVIDNGIGIQSVDKDHVFQMFLRASERSDIGGIGLYLSKLATEKLGGKISLQNTTEKGTEFHVLFPEDLHVVIFKRNEEEAQRMREREARKQLLKDSFVS